MTDHDKSKRTLWKVLRTFTPILNNQHFELVKPDIFELLMRTINNFELDCQQTNIYTCEHFRCGIRPICLPIFAIRTLVMAIHKSCLTPYTIRTFLASHDVLIVSKQIISPSQIEELLGEGGYGEYPWSVDLSFVDLR